MIFTVYLTNVNIDKRIFLLYLIGINRTFVQKFICVFFFKEVNVTKVTMVNEENDYSLREYSIITSLTKFLLIFKNPNATACYLIFP